MIELNESQLKKIAHNYYHPIHHKGLLAVLTQDFILLPCRVTLEFLASMLTPCAGSGKDCGLGMKMGLHLMYGCLFLIGLFVSPPFLLVGLPLLYYTYQYRPQIGYLKYGSKDRIARKTNNGVDLRVRTHNIAMLYDHVNILNDLRPIKDRINEIIEWIENDPTQPDIICFQEAFNTEAIKAICDRLGSTYPHIVHSLAPRFLGFGAGLMTLSQYPIKKVSFRPFQSLGGGEQIANKGLLRTQIEIGPNRVIDIYNTHLLSMLDRSRCQIRYQQIREIIQWIRSDDPQYYLLMGDFNISKTTIWNEQNCDDDQSFDLIKEYFKDSLDPATQKWAGTWYHGPYAHKPLIWLIKEWIDYHCHGYPYRTPYYPLYHINTWGTHKWNNQPQVSNTRFDYILVDKDSTLAISSQIRHIDLPNHNLESASSDHLAVDAEIRFN